MADNLTAWPNVELRNLDYSLEELQNAVSVAASGKKQRRGFKAKAASSKEEAKAHVADDVDSVLNHAFAYTDARPHLSMEQTLALRRLRQHVDRLQQGQISEDVLNKAFKAAIRALDGERLVPGSEENNATTDDESSKKEEKKNRNNSGQFERRCLRPRVKRNVNLGCLFWEEFGDLDPDSSHQDWV